MLTGQCVQEIGCGLAHLLLKENLIAQLASVLFYMVKELNQLENI